MRNCTILLEFEPMLIFKKNCLNKEFCVIFLFSLKFVVYNTYCPLNYKTLIRDNRHHANFLAHGLHRLLLNVYGINVNIGRFHQHFTCSFYACRSQKCKNTVKSSVFFCAFGICERKS